MSDFTTIKANLSKKRTEDLLDIWTRNKRDEWSDEAFDAIHHILTERGAELPAQRPFVPPKKQETKIDWVWIGTIIVFAFAFSIARQFPKSPVAHFIETAALGGAAGALVGLLPYYLGKARGHFRLSDASLIACTACGALLGLLLAGPLAVLFAIIILLRKKMPRMPG